MSTRLLVADSHEMARLGLRTFLSGTEFHVVAEAATGEEAVALVLSTVPDMVILAVRMPTEGGLAALQRIKQAHPQIPVIVTATESHSGQLTYAHARGASAFLPKTFDRESLIETLRAVAQGEQVGMQARLRHTASNLTTVQVESDLLSPLTPRENDVLRSLAEGTTNRAIAGQLGISYETVKEHVQHILRKVGVNDRTQAAVWAVRHGIV